MRVAPLAALLLLAAAGCHSGGGGGTGESVAGAAHAFMSFAKHGEAPERPDAVHPGETPKIAVTERRVLPGARTRIDLVLDLPLQTSRAAVCRDLEAAVRGPDGAGAAVVRARAWPSKLRHLAGPFGTMILSNDGRGWDGKPQGAAITRVSDHLGTAFRIPEIRALRAIDDALGAGTKQDHVVEVAAKASRLSKDAIRQALEKAGDTLPPTSGGRWCARIATGCGCCSPSRASRRWCCSATTAPARALRCCIRMPRRSRSTWCRRGWPP